MQERYGKQHFDFVPDTYILPDEFGEFYEHYQKLKQHDSKKNIWIVKPAHAAQGRGIALIDDINDVNVDELSVISRYVTNPLLINGHKFDLRIYVLVTSYEPLKIYIFQEGLARFASETYTSKINKNNKYMHLTNYSINKKNEKFIKNENCEQDDFGYKWSLGAFCRHLEQVGIDMNLLWSRSYDVIIKTLLAGENYVVNQMKKNGTHRTNCFEILGFDILIDSDLKPWLLEVNLSSSLACDSPLDFAIKSNLINDCFNLIGVKRFDRKKESLNKIKHRMKGLYNKSKKTNLGNGIQGTSIAPNGTGQDIYGGGTSN
jgi:tubulin polyglutamylase TTLL5